MAAITDELLKNLKFSSDIEEFFQKYESCFIDETPVGYMNKMLKYKNTTVSDVAKNSGVGEYAYKVFKGDRTPSRDVLIALSFGLNLQLEEAQLLLRISKFAVLDSRNKRDSIIIYALSHDLSVFEADDLLEEQNTATIN